MLIAISCIYDWLAMRWYECVCGPDSGCYHGCRRCCRCRNLVHTHNRKPFQFMPQTYDDYSNNINKLVWTQIINPILQIWSWLYGNCASLVCHAIPNYIINAQQLWYMIYCISANLHQTSYLKTIGVAAAHFICGQVYNHRTPFTQKDLT